MATTNNLFPIIGQEEEPLVAEIAPVIPINPVLQTNTDPDIRKHFPFPTIRPAQETALNSVVESAAAGKKFTLIEAPTGVGKSGIAMAVGSWAKTQACNEPFQNGSVVLSTQKTLTKQYMRDFAQMGLLELKGRSNYQCACHNTDCGSAAIFQTDDPEDNCSKRGVCPYSNAKAAFKSSMIGVTNFSYFLTETMYASQLRPRNYLILDECHNVENQILGFTDTLFTTQRAAELDLELPIYKPGVADNTGRAITWLTEVALPKLCTYINDIEAQVKEAKSEGNKDEAIRLAKKFDALNNFKERIQMFTESDRPQDWLAFSDINEKGYGSKNLIIKPLTATLFAEDIMFRKANNIVMMSATILDFKTFMRNLGIDPAQTNTMAVPSEFPLENRPIYFKPIANMGWKTRETAMPLIAEEVYNLLTKKKYANVKGIVHTQSYAITKYIIDYLTSRGLGSRLITHSSNPKKDGGLSREEAVAKHTLSPEPTILLSPSMTEGLDLKEDLSRLQIITKVPYPFLDPYTKARMERDKDWYQWQTALTLIQATGRSVRSKTDKADTWVLDEGFRQFIIKNEAVLPTWWTDSIVFL